MRTSTLAIAFVVSTLTRQASGQTRVETGPNYFTRTNPSAGTSLPVLPMKLPPPTADGRIILNLNTPNQRELTIVPELQAGLTAFIAERGAPIAAIIVADAKSGSILAMAEGRSPESWGGTTHSALHAQFPAASLFKTVVTAAAFEIADFNDEKPVGLAGGCGNVEPTGRWLYDTIQGQSYMTMKRAFGLSCNSFYAKLAVNVLGLGLVRDFAQKFGYGAQPPADFHIDPGTIMSPSVATSSTYTVGRFAAGFGVVTTSVAHAASTMLAIANDGIKVPLKAFKDTPAPEQPLTEKMIEPETALQLRNIMKATIRGGTASFAFSRGKTRNLRSLVGGKTGTLMGRSPLGLTTLFTGMMPIDNPEIVVASIVILEDRWVIKAPSLAAEAFQLWSEIRTRDGKFTTARKDLPRKAIRKNHERGRDKT